MMKMKIPAFVVLLFSVLVLTQCKTDCIETDKCSLEPDSGLCKAAIPKYYFDKKDKKCKEFSWGGCGGVVPFETMEECEKQCDCN
jgi:hypothetical protein